MNIGGTKVSAICSVYGVLHNDHCHLHSGIWAMKLPGWARRPAARWSPPTADTASDNSSTPCRTCRTTPRTKRKEPCRSTTAYSLWLLWYGKIIEYEGGVQISGGTHLHGGADDQLGRLQRCDLARQVDGRDRGRQQVGPVRAHHGSHRVRSGPPSLLSTYQSIYTYHACYHYHPIISNPLLRYQGASCWPGG